jgi:hypothetical protein
MLLVPRDYSTNSWGNVSTLSFTDQVWSVTVVLIFVIVAVRMIMNF